MTLTKWQQELLFEVETTRDPDSGSTVFYFASAIVAAVKGGVPVERVAATAGLSAREVRQLVSGAEPAETQR